MNHILGPDAFTSNNNSGYCFYHKTCYSRYYPYPLHIHCSGLCWQHSVIIPCHMAASVRELKLPGTTFIQRWLKVKGKYFSSSPIRYDKSWCALHQVPQRDGAVLTAIICLIIHLFLFLVSLSAPLLMPSELTA